MKRFLIATLLIFLLTGCANSPFKSEHYFGYSCYENFFAPFYSYCLESDNQKQINPEVAAWMKKSRVMVEQKNWSEAIRMASAAISIDPFYPDAYALRSWAHLESGFRENALADAEKALQLGPGNTAALNNRGLYYLRGGHFMKAKDDFKKACQGGLVIGCENIKLTMGYCLIKAEEAFSKKDWDSVIRFTSEIAENEVALSVRGGAYANKQLLVAAMADCDAAIKMNPNLALAYNNKGYALELMGKKKEAALNYQFACNLNMPLGCSNRKRLTASEK
jgi:tetratricopeptide (TPR) repeat protein